MEIERGNYLTRNGTRASVYEWGKNSEGRECWRGTVQGGGMNDWDREGHDLYGTTDWDLVERIDENKR